MIKTIHICDKCGKKILDDAKQTASTRSWNSYKTLTLNSDETHKIKINGQMVEVQASIKLACGQELELCHDCGWKIMEVAVPQTKSKKKGKK